METILHASMTCAAPEPSAKTSTAAEALNDLFHQFRFNEAEFNF